MTAACTKVHCTAVDEAQGDTQCEAPYLSEAARLHHSLE